MPNESSTDPAQQGRAADCLQRTLRSNFRQQLTASVRSIEPLPRRPIFHKIARGVGAAAAPGADAAGVLDERGGVVVSLGSFADFARLPASEPLVS